MVRVVAAAVVPAFAVLESRNQQKSKSKSKPRTMHPCCFIAVVVMGIFLGLHPLLSFEFESCISLNDHPHAMNHTLLLQQQRQPYFHEDDPRYYHRVQRWDSYSDGSYDLELEYEEDDDDIEFGEYYYYNDAIDDDDDGVVGAFLEGIVAEPPSRTPPVPSPSSRGRYRRDDDDDDDDYNDPAEERERAMNEALTILKTIKSQLVSMKEKREIGLDQALLSRSMGYDPIDFTSWRTEVTKFQSSGSSSTAVATTQQQQHVVERGEQQQQQQQQQRLLAPVVFHNGNDDEQNDDNKKILNDDSDSLYYPEQRRYPATNKYSKFWGLVDTLEEKVDVLEGIVSDFQRNLGLEG